MSQENTKELFVLLRSAIRGEKLTEKNSYSLEQLYGLLKISSKHDLDHFLALGLKQNELISQKDIEIDKCILKAVYRYEQLNYEYKNLCDIFEAKGIPFIPLKGSVIREYYPEPWMRTSCDIDILIHTDDIERASALLVDECGYTFERKGSHDVSFLAPNNMHIELHYDLIEEGCANLSAEVLASVWENTVVRAGFEYWYEMTDEMFYFYHIAHMAKHFEEGGCGIRPFIDLWILDNIEGVDHFKRDELLKKGNLLKFAESVRKLSRVWFGSEKRDSVSQQIESYILCGGVYGSTQNRVIIQQQKHGGRLKYAFSRIFIPYDTIKFHYPILEKHRWLTPIMEVRRWCKLIFCGRIRHSLRELKYNGDISTEDALATQHFLNDIGL